MNIKLLNLLLIGSILSLVILNACQKEDEPLIEYTITYHNVGTKNATSNPTTYTVETSDISLATPSDSTNYTFVGWFTNASYTDTISTPAIVQSSTGNKNFYAKWVANEFTITYHNVGTLNSVSNPATYTVESGDIILAQPVDSTGYAFGGWFTNSECTNTISTPAIAEGSSGNKDFYAKWVATFTDTRDGNIYKWVKIGDQIWMAENLAYLPSVDDNSSFSTKRTPGYGVYGYDGNNIAAAKAHTEEINGKTVNMYETYGVLYNGYAVKEANICPDGWHIPTDDEWNELIEYLATNGHRGTEGTALKAASGWFDNGKGTDDFGFAALPSGFRAYIGGTSGNVGFSGCWWSSTENANGDVWARYVNKVDTNVTRLCYTKLLGFSIRCIRD